MATYNKFECFAGDIGRAWHNLLATGDTLNVYLSDATPSASADSVKADLAEIASGNGYVTNGADVTNTWTEASGTATLAGTNVSWTATGGSIPTAGTFQYVVLMNNTTTGATKPLIAWWDYGTGLTLNSGESFTVKFNNGATGGTIFTLS